MKTPVLFALSLSLSVSGMLYAHDQDDGVAPRFVEKLGAFVPLSLPFRAEDGDAMRLADAIEVPTILTLVFYNCVDDCLLLQANLATTLRSLPAGPGVDYAVLTVSFDENETPEQARSSKGISMSMLPSGFPQAAWRFLTGEAAQVDGLTDAVGFHFVRRGDDFVHPLGLVVLSSSGKIIRYLRGKDFMAGDLKLALLEASDRPVQSTVGGLLRYYVEYEPRSRTLRFSMIKVTATAALLLAVSFGIFLLVSRQRRRVDVRR